MQIFGMRRKTIHNWFGAWETRKLVGLMNRNNDLSAYVFESSITSAVILACIELNAYETRESLVSYVEKVLRDFGSNYVINFA